MAFSLDDLNQIILSRADGGGEGSYTAGLLDAGVDKCAQKLGEEAVEAVIAAVGNEREELTKEAADLLYHLLVVLKACDVPLQSVMNELESRTSQSGLEEKASRQG